VTVLLGSKHQEIAHAARVAPLVIVPGNELDKFLVEGNTSSSIKDGRGVVADEIRGDDRVFSVLHDALHGTSGGLLDGGLDVVIRGLLLEADDEIHNGDIRGGDTEGETTEVR
jgi:hypothetical protein